MTRPTTAPSPTHRLRVVWGLTAILAAILMTAGCTIEQPADNSGISILARDVAGEAFDLVYGSELGPDLINTTCTEFNADPDVFVSDFIEGYNSTAAYDLSHHEDTEWVTSKFVALCEPHRAADVRYLAALERNHGAFSHDQNALLTSIGRNNCVLLDTMSPADLHDSLTQPGGLTSDLAVATIEAAEAVYCPKE